MFENLSPGQRQMLVIGAPVVAVFALVSVLKKGGPTSPAPASGAMSPAPVASTNALGVGQLSEYESLLSGQLSQLASQVAQLPGQLAQPAPVVIPAPSPAPLPRVNSADYPIIAPAGIAMDILGTIGAGGFQGANVQGGAPVYANINGSWQQDWIGALPQGTALATPATFGAYIVPAALS